jgi:hypothetical protein
MGSRLYNQMTGNLVTGCPMVTVICSLMGSLMESLMRSLKGSLMGSLTSTPTGRLRLCIRPWRGEGSRPSRSPLPPSLDPGGGPRGGRGSLLQRGRFRGPAAHTRAPLDAHAHAHAHTPPKANPT